MNILVIGPSWVGDMVMAQSLFMVLRQQHPSANIDVLAPQWSLPLLARMPEVRRSIVMPLGHGQLQLKVRYQLGKQLRHQYQQVIVLPNSLKSALLPFWANIPKRTGFVGEMRWGLLNDVRRLDKQKLPMTVQRFMALGLEPLANVPTEIPSPCLSIVPTAQQQALQAFNLDWGQQKILGLCPGAEYGVTKRWPVGYFAELAQSFLEKDWQVWIFGSEKDAAIGNAIQLLVDDCIDLTGQTNLEQAIDLLSLTDVVVSNDSGLMHVASAVGRPVVALYGSSDPNFTPPLSEQAKILSLGLECSPCFQRQCPLEHLNCLKQMKPTQVIAAVLELVEV